MTISAIVRERGLVGVLLVLAIAPTASAQDYLRSFGTDPIVVFSGDGHRAPVHRILYTRDGQQLLTAGEDREVLIWNLAENPPRLASNSLRPLIWKNRRGAIYAMALAPGRPNEASGGGLFILGGYGIERALGTLTLFRFPGLAPGDRRDTGELLGHWPGDLKVSSSGDLNGHVGEIRDLAFDPSGKFVASASYDQKNPIQIWDVAKGAKQRRLSDAGGKFWADCLAYTPDGNQLIAGGIGQDNAPDGWIRIWDLRKADDSRPIRVSVGNDARTLMVKIQALAVSPEGRWLVVGLSGRIRGPRQGDDSGLVLVDLKAPQGLVARVLPFERPDKDATRRFLGRVESVTFLDAQRFAVASAVEVGPTTPTRRTPEGTWVQIRSVPDGKVLENVRNPEDDPAAPAKPWPGLIRTLAVRPDGKQLAFVEGEHNRVVLKDLGQLNAPAVDLAGAAAEGEKAWQVGFAGNGPIPKLAYSAAQPAAAAAGAGRPPFDGFDLETLQPTADPIAADTVTRAIPAFGGYSVRVSQQQGNPLELVGPGGVVRTIPLHRNRHGAWMTWTFIPPTQDHPRPCLAVACQFGVAIFALDGNGPHLARFLDGHSAEVLDLAPDPSGRWLVTGGADQTVRLWSLAGCDRIPSLGAHFVRRGPRLVVSAVDRRSPADLQGLKPGDQITLAAVGQQQGKLVNLVTPDLRNNPQAALDQAEPGESLTLTFLRPNPRALKGDYEVIMGLPEGLQLATRKVEAPALSLFRAGQDWIVWMPQGYYETSVQGDRFYLGWHVNNNEPDILLHPERQPRPTLFVPMITFQDRLRKPEVLGRLLQTGSPIQALPSSPRGPILTAGGPKPPSPPLRPELPMLVTAIEPRPLQPADVATVPGRDAARVNVANLPVRVRIEGQPGQRATRVRVLDNGREEQDLANPALDDQGRLDLGFAIAPGQRRKTIEVTTDNGLTSEFGWDYEHAEAPPDHEARLVVLAYGPSFDQLGSYALAHAPKDALRVGDGLGKLLVQPLKTPEPYPNTTVTILHEARDGQDDASPQARSLREALEGLEREVAAGKLGRPTTADAERVQDGGSGRVDTVVLFLNTHLMVDDYRELILGEAEDEHELPALAIRAEDVARSLGKLVRHGCRVAVFVDGIHRKSDRDHKFDAREWFRQLQAERVATFSATGDSRPSQVIGNQNGAFALGILQVAEGERGNRYASEPSLTGEMLGTALDELIQGVTKKTQHPQFYGSRTSWDFLPLVGWPVDAPAPR